MVDKLHDIGAKKGINCRIPCHHVSRAEVCPKCYIKLFYPVISKDTWKDRSKFNLNERKST